MSKNGYNSYFERVANDILQSADQIVARMEEGISIIMNGSPLPNDDDTHNNNNIQQQTEKETEFLQQEDDSDNNINNNNFDNPLQGLADSVLDGIMSSQTKPQTTWEHIQAFTNAINWTEPLLIGIIVFHICMIVITYWITRKHCLLKYRIPYMIGIGLIVRCAEYINIFCSQHYIKIATQNYFDTNGIFILILICVPLLIHSLFFLLCCLREASTLLIQVKTTELKKKMIAASKQQQQNQQNQAQAQAQDTTNAVTTTGTTATTTDTSNNESSTKRRGKSKKTD